MHLLQLLCLQHEAPGLKYEFIGDKNMGEKEPQQNKNTAESFGDLVQSFASAVGKIFDEPVLKEKAKEFGKSAAASAEAFGDRFKDDEVKAKFREVGKAAEKFGKSVSDAFSDKDAK